MSKPKVYIGRLSSRATERDIEKFFKGYGRIRDVILKNGFGFVEFDDYRDADDAIYELNGKEMCGEKVVLEHAKLPRSARGGGGDRRRYGPPVRTDYRVLVENLSSRVSWQDLKDFMRQAGEVTFADAHRDHKNEGTVEFASYSEMRKAVEKLDGTELHGKKIRIVEDRKSRSRSHSRSRSRSHTRSKSRSRSRSRSRSDRSRSRTKSGSRRRSHSKSHSRSQSRDHKSPSDDVRVRGDKEIEIKEEGAPQPNGNIVNGDVRTEEAMDNGEERSGKPEPETE